MAVVNFNYLRLSLATAEIRLKLNTHTQTRAQQTARQQQRRTQQTSSSSPNKISVRELLTNNKTMRESNAKAAPSLVASSQRTVRAYSCTALDHGLAMGWCCSVVSLALRAAALERVAACVW